MKLFSISERSDGKCVSLSKHENDTYTHYRFLANPDHIWATREIRQYKDGILVSETYDRRKLKVEDNPENEYPKILKTRIKFAGGSKELLTKLRKLQFGDYKGKYRCESLEIIHKMWDKVIPME